MLRNEGSRGQNMIKTIQMKSGVVEYRSEGVGPVVLVLNGGHTNCTSPFEHEEFFLEKGYRLVIPSRPGYRNTTSSSGRTAEGFADTLASLLEALKIDKVIVIGISAAGRTALHFAKNYPKLVTKLILESAVTCEAWPDLGTRIGATIIFNRFIEGITWSVFRLLGKHRPSTALKIMMKSLSSLNSQGVIDSWNKEERREVLEFLLASRSGAGFLNDISHTCDNLSLITVPTLIIASIYDKAVNPQHSRIAAEQICGAELMMVPSDSHLIWFSKYKVEIENKINEFLLN
jgi:pimeloyl-ACP methyl ester carboxylesterase